MQIFDVEVDGKTVKRNSEIFDHRNENSSLPKEQYKFHSNHYHKADGGIEAIEFITKNKYTYCQASALKYLDRAGKKKGQEVLDIVKLIDFALLLAYEQNIDVPQEQVEGTIRYRYDWLKEKLGERNEKAK